MWKNLLAVLFGLLLAGILSEVILRLFDPFEFRQKGDQIILPAHEKKTFENPDLPGLDSLIIHSKNSLGFRGPELPDTSDSLKTIIAMGGSTTECFYLSDGKDWPNVLGQQLNREDQRFWINNAGLDGHSSFGHLILMRDYILDLKPDYVLFLLGCNDIGRDDLTDFDRQHLQGEYVTWQQYLRNNSELFSLIANLRRHLRSNRRKLEHPGLRLDELGRAAPFSEVDSQTLIRSHQLYLDHYSERLNLLIQLCKENDIQAILLTQPTLVGTSKDPITGVDLSRIQYCHPQGGKAYWNLLEAYNQVSRQIAEKEGILCIDLAHLMPKSSAYFYDCMHFSNAGAEKVAEIVTDSLQVYLK